MDERHEQISQPNIDPGVAPRVAVMWRGNPAEPQAQVSYETRLVPVMEALKAQGLSPEGLVWFDDRADEILTRLKSAAAVLVWINPLQDGRDRSGVDAVLREAAAAGVRVSAHPDTIARMGTKEVLYATRSLGWGSDTDLYDSIDAFSARFWPRIEAGQARVLKPLRGNDGQGVLKIRAAEGGGVSVQHAADDSRQIISREALELRVREIFARAGRIIDQAFNDNAEAGMVRCYLSVDRVAGFAEQRPRNPGENAFAMNSAKAMHEPSSTEFADLRQAMEEEWIPGLRRILGLATEDLPVLWDADFLYRPAAEAARAGRFVLCEINVSCVSPFPPGAPAMLAAAVKHRLAV